jgi:uroporphyrin-III C-methyltransferase
LLAEAVSTPEQSLHRSTVSELARRLEAEIGDKPALILYGPLAGT